MYGEIMVGGWPLAVHWGEPQVYVLEQVVADVYWEVEGVWVVDWEVDEQVERVREEDRVWEVDLVRAVVVCWEVDGKLAVDTRWGVEVKVAVAMTRGDCCCTEHVG